MNDLELILLQIYEYKTNYTTHACESELTDQSGALIAVVKWAHTSGVTSLPWSNEYTPWGDVINVRRDNEIIQFQLIPNKKNINQTKIENCHL